MNKDYYSILKVQKSANHIDLCKAYKSLSLEFHPQNINQTNQTPESIINYRIFSDLSEAYLVLSDRKLRAIYDKQGYRQFTRGGKTDEGEHVTGFQFMGNSKEIFETFFGTANFFNALVEDEDEYNKYLKRQSCVKVNEPVDIIVEHSVSLRDVFKGVSFQVEFSRQIIESDLIKTRQIKTSK